MIPQPTIGRLEEVFSYRPKTGKLFWRVSCGGKMAGSPAGNIDNDGYLRLQLDGKKLRVHRIIYALHYGWIPDKVDHQDGNRKNNRPSNLRACTARQNSCNRKPVKRKKKGIKSKGVSWHKGNKKFIARIKHCGKSMHLGYFNTEKEAAEAYRTAAKELQGDFARF